MLKSSNPDSTDLKGAVMERLKDVLQGITPDNIQVDNTDYCT